jgi:hypothetical protein
MRYLLCRGGSGISVCQNYLIASVLLMLAHPGKKVYSAALLASNGVFSVAKPYTTMRAGEGSI